jgi:hypothetical protein
MKIYAPVKNTNGVYASVRFVNGVGETDNPRLIEWFRSNGYSLEKCEDSVRIPQENCDEPDFDAMTPNELRDWMKANGLGMQIKNIRNKEKLLEIIRG